MPCPGSQNVALELALAVSTKALWIPICRCICYIQELHWTSQSARPHHIKFHTYITRHFSVGAQNLGHPIHGLNAKWHEVLRPEKDLESSCNALTCRCGKGKNGTWNDATLKGSSEPTINFQMPFVSNSGRVYRLLYGIRHGIAPQPNGD